MAKDIVLRTKLKGANKTKKGLKGIDSGIRSIGKSAMALGAGFFAAQGIISGFRSVISAAGQQELAEKKLESALGRTSQALLNQASALQQVSMFGDEAIIEAQALIAAFVDDEEQIKKATQATLDLAAAKGMDLTAAADLVSKTLGSSTNAMSRYGIEVTGAVGSTERLNSLTGNIANLFGGQASAQAETMTGSIEQMKNAVGDAAEAIGTLLSPVVITVTEGIKFLAEGLNMVITTFDDAISISNAQALVLTEAGIAYENLNNLIQDDSLPALLNLREEFEKQVEGVQIVTPEIQHLLDMLNLVNTEIVERGTPELIRFNEQLLLTAQGVDKVTASEDKLLTKKIAKQKLVLQELKQAALVQGSAQDAMRAVVRAETMEAVSGYISSVLKTVPYPLNLILAAGGGAVVGGLMDKAIGSFATGGDFVTSGPQMMMVGDNPGGRERVQVTPIGSPNIEGPQGGITLNISAPLVDETVIDHIIPAIQKAQRLNLA